MSTDLIKRIETLEKEWARFNEKIIEDRRERLKEFHKSKSGGMAMEGDFKVLHPKAKYATGILVNGIDKPILHEKHVEFTHRLCGVDGWEAPTFFPSDHDKVVYLGKCDMDGDMFAAYVFGTIDIFKGHLNSGTY